MYSNNVRDRKRMPEKCDLGCFVQIVKGLRPNSGRLALARPPGSLGGRHDRQCSRHASEPEGLSAVAVAKAGNRLSAHPCGSRDSSLLTFRSEPTYSF